MKAKAKLKIIVTRRAGDPSIVEAHVESNPGIMGAGPTIEAAIGSCLFQIQDQLGLEIDLSGAYGGLKISPVF